MQQFVDEIVEQLESFLREGKKVCVSSSFQTHSIPLLHIISRIDRTIPIYFLNTGYHFPETFVFKRQLSDLLDLNTIDLQSSISMSHQKDQHGNLLYTSDPDFCCQLNKTLPMRPILAVHDIWITGVRADQSQQRKQMESLMTVDENTMRFHPMLFWTSKMIYEYRKTHQLPEHPLESQGYVSIGCEPCTIKYTVDQRAGRWNGMKKEECGLHTELIKKR